MVCARQSPGCRHTGHIVLGRVHPLLLTCPFFQFICDASYPGMNLSMLLSSRSFTSLGKPVMNTVLRECPKQQRHVTRGCSLPLAVVQAVAACAGCCPLFMTFASALGKGMGSHLSSSTAPTAPKAGTEGTV